MYTPELNEVIRLAKTHNLIPVVRHLMADTETPIRGFQHFYEEQRAFLLESVEGGVKWARYSFIGTDPFLMVKGKHGRMEIELNGVRQVVDEKPLDILKGLLRGYSSPALPDFPPFSGGAIGFFGYDLLQYYEKLPSHRHDDLNMNDIEFMFCDQVIVFDHFKQQLKVIGNVHIEKHATDAQIAEAYRLTCVKIDAMIERLQQPVPQRTKQNAIPADIDLGEVHSNLTKEQYIGNVEKAKEFIRAGDIFQVVLSQRFHIETEIDPLYVYRVLRTMNPSPYMYYLKMDDEVIVGTSPEALVKVDGERVHDS